MTPSFFTPYYSSLPRSHPAMTQGTIAKQPIRASSPAVTRESSTIPRASRSNFVSGILRGLPEINMYRAKVNNVFRLLEEFVTDLGMPHAHRIEGWLWEFRPGENRLFYFLYLKRKFVILHGFRKQTMKTPEKEITTALRRLKEISEE